MIILLLMLVATAAVAQPEVVGKRPYEMVWAHRTKDDHPPLVDFEDLSGWKVQTDQAVATFTRTREQQLWGKYVGKLTYRATGEVPQVRFGPAQPIKITKPFDAVTCWVYGNTWGYARDLSTPSVSITALFDDPQGQEISVPLGSVNWKYWFLLHRRLQPDEIARVKHGATFKGFLIQNGRNKADRVLYFDNLAVFTEQFPPLKFEPQPKRGIPMFPGETVGTNTGPGKLPFPTRLQTILPPNLTSDFKTSLTEENGTYIFTYSGSDGQLIYRLKPASGTLGDLTAQWEGRGPAFRPCVDGGVWLQGTGDKAVAPEKFQPLGVQRQGDEVRCRWRVSAGNLAADVTYVYRLWNKSMVIDVIAPGGEVGEVHYGYAEGLQNPRLVTNPYYVYGANRPAVVVCGPPDKPLFVTGNTDWYLSDASQLYAVNDIDQGRVSYNGGTRYIHLTNGKRNDCYERFFITVSPRYDEVLPTIPNPKSPWMKVTGTHVWRAYGAGNRQTDAAFWTNVHRYGMTQCVITDHETEWRDGGESFTFRTRTAPGKGGDKGQYDYARLMQDKLGFVYGPYNNFTDFDPVNQYWSFDLISRTPDNQLQHAWMRCYAPKPARAVEYCAKLAPIIQKKFHFSTAYCDVHTAVAPWDRVDYDYRVPGAGTFAAVYYAFGEIMLLQKKAWDGPVYSEGGHHAFYCGLTDGNYGQDQRYDLPNKPWLVDFDLRRMHDLCCNFGMGNPGMFYSRGHKAPADKDVYEDRFLAATVAFGHPGFLTFEGGFQNALRSYYMLQQLPSSYTQSSVAEIRYADADGKLYHTSEAIARDIYPRSQIVTRYANGCVTVVNGSQTERMKVDAYGRKLDLPPNGYAGWTSDGSIEVLSSDPDGHRIDYAATPAYIYIDGRGRFTRMPKAGSDGIGICRILPGDKYEIIPYQGADCGFAIKAASAVALDKAGKQMGPAQLRVSRGLTYVIPVKDAFSYLLTSGTPATGVALKCDRDMVVPGEQVTVEGRQAHQFTVPADSHPGQRLWKQFEGSWIDFTVVAMTDATVSLDGNLLTVDLKSNLPRAQPVSVTTAGMSKAVTLTPGQSQKVSFDLGQPQEEDARVLAVDLRAGQFHQHLERGLITVRQPVPVAQVPQKWEAGMALRGHAETADFGQTRGYVAASRSTCGGVIKDSIAMSPPYVGGVGYSFALLDPVKLPARPAAAFRAMVGKGDGSYTGDGILYKLAVVDQTGKEHVLAQTVVVKHQWQPIEADLSAYAGQTIRLKLISDVGVKNDSNGDWACWADMRLETIKPVLTRILQASSGPYQRAAGPFPMPGLTVAQLRQAKSGLLHYEGCGLAGTGEEYGSFAVLNGVKLGNMAPAGGDERQGKYVAVSVPLTAAALAKLGWINKFEILNPHGDSFKVRRFWIELTLANGRRASSDISTATFSQPGNWLYAEGIGVPFTKNLTVDIWFQK